MLQDISFQDLDYKHLVSIKFEEKRNYPLLIITLVAFFFILGLQYLKGVPDLGAFNQLLDGICYLTGAAGIIFAILAFLKGVIIHFNTSSTASNVSITDSGFFTFSTKKHQECIKTVRIFL